MREVHTLLCSTNFRAHLGLNFSNSFVKSAITEQIGFIYLVLGFLSSCFSFYYFSSNISPALTYLSIYLYFN